MGNCGYAKHCAVMHCRGIASGHTCMYSWQAPVCLRKLLLSLSALASCCRYHHLASANEQLASQLKEAHEALYDLQAAVQATPPAKRQQQRQLMARVADAEQVSDI